LAAGQRTVAEVTGATALGVGGDDAFGDLRQRLFQTEISSHVRSSSIPPAPFPLDILRGREKRDKLPFFIFGRNSGQVEKNRRAGTPTIHSASRERQRPESSILRSLTLPARFSPILPSPEFSASTALPPRTGRTTATGRRRDRI